MDNSTTDALKTATAKNKITSTTAALSNINKNKFIPFLPSTSFSSSFDNNNIGNRSNNNSFAANQLSTNIKNNIYSLSHSQPQQQPYHQNRNREGVGPAVGGGAGAQPSNANRAVKSNQSSYYNINNINNSQQNVILKGNVSTGDGSNYLGQTSSTMRYEDEGTYYNKNHRNKYNSSSFSYNNRHNNFSNDRDEEGDEAGGGKFKLRPSQGKSGKGHKEIQHQHYVSGSMQTTLNSYHKTINNQLVMRSMLGDLIYDSNPGGRSDEPNQKLLTWLEEELDSMGIDPIIYRPYVLSILAHNNEEQSNDNRKPSSAAPSSNYSSINSTLNSSGPSSSSTIETDSAGTSVAGRTNHVRYCDLHQRPYPFGGGAIANRMKVTAGMLRSKENTQKPASTTKWMHKRYLQQNNSPTDSNGSLNLLSEEDYCPDCLNSRSYRRMIVIDTLKAATDEPNSVEAFVDELFHRYEKLQRNAQQGRNCEFDQERNEKVRVDYEERARHAQNKYTLTPFVPSKHFEQQRKYDLASYNCISSDHKSDEEPDENDNNDMRDKYFSKRSTQTYGMQRLFDRRGGHKQYSISCEEEGVEDDKPQQSQGSRNIHVQAMQYFAAFPSLSGDSSSNKEGATQVGSSNNTSGVSSSGSSISSSILPSLSSPHSKRIFSQQSSIEDSVFGEAAITTTSAVSVLTNTNTTTSLTTKTGSGQWNGQRLISSVKSTISNGSIISSVLGVGSSGINTGGNKIGESGDLKTIGGSRKLTASGKARLVVVGAAPPPTQSSGVSTFTTLKKKVSSAYSNQSNTNSSTVTTLTNVVTTFVTSSSTSTRSTISTLNDKTKITTKEQEKVFALLPSFMNPMKKTSVITPTTTSTVIISTVTTTTISTAQSVSPMFSSSSTPSAYTLSPGPFNPQRSYSSWSHWNYKRSNYTRQQQSMARGAPNTSSMSISNGSSQTTTPTMYAQQGRPADYYQHQQQQQSYYQQYRNNNVAMRSSEHYHHNSTAIESSHNNESRTGHGGNIPAIMTGTSSRKQQPLPPQSTESLIDLLPSYLKTQNLTGLTSGSGSGSSGGAAVAKDSNADNNSLKQQPKDRKCERSEDQCDNDDTAGVYGDDGEIDSVSNRLVSFESNDHCEQKKTTNKIMLLCKNDTMTHERNDHEEEEKNYNAHSSRWTFNGSTSLIDQPWRVDGGKECQQPAEEASTATTTAATLASSSASSTTLVSSMNNEVTSKCKLTTTQNRQAEDNYQLEHHQQQLLTDKKDLSIKSTINSDSAQTSTSIDRMAPTTDTISSLILPFTMQQQQQLVFDFDYDAKSEHQHSSSMWPTIDVTKNDENSKDRLNIKNINQMSMFWNKHSTLNWMSFNISGSKDEEDGETDIGPKEGSMSSSDDVTAGFDWTRVPFYHQQDETESKFTSTTLVNHESTSSAFLEVTTKKSKNQQSEQQQSTKSIAHCNVIGVAEPLPGGDSLIETQKEPIAIVDSPFQPIEADDNSHDLQALLSEGRQIMLDNDNNSRAATGGGSFSASRFELEGYIENRRQIWAQLKASIGSQASSGLSSLLSLHCDSDSSSMSSSFGAGSKFFANGHDLHQQLQQPEIDTHYQALSKSLSSIDNERSSRCDQIDLNVNSTTNVSDFVEVAKVMQPERDVSILAGLLSNINLRGHETSQHSQPQLTINNNNMNIFDCPGDPSPLTNLLNDVFGDLPTESTFTNLLQNEKSNLVPNLPTTMSTVPDFTNTTVNQNNLIQESQEISISSLPYSKRHKAKNGFVYGKVEFNQTLVVPPQNTGHNRSNNTSSLDGDTMENNYDNLEENQEIYTDVNDDNVYFEDDYYYNYDQDGQLQQEYQDYRYNDEGPLDGYEMSAEEYNTYDEFLKQQEQQQTFQQSASAQQQQSTSGGVSSLFNVLQFKTDIRGVDPVVLASKPSQKPCSFFMDGFCARGDCKFSHDLSSITCKYWMEGFCLKDEHCSFRHSFPDSDEANKSFGGDYNTSAALSSSLGRSKLDPNVKSFDFNMEDSDFPALTLEEVEQQQQKETFACNSDADSNPKNPLKAVFASTHKQGNCHFSIGPQQQQQQPQHQPHSKNSKHKNRIKLNDLNALDKMLTSSATTSSSAEKQKRSDQVSSSGITKSLSQVLKATTGAKPTKSQQKNEPAVPIQKKVEEEEWPSLMSKSLRASVTSTTSALDFPELSASASNSNSMEDDKATTDRAQFRDKVKSAKTSKSGGKGKRGKCGNGLGKMVPLKGFLEC